MTKRAYAWIPDVPDHRDRYLAAKRVKLPSAVPILGKSNRIENQGRLSSCTGNATTSALEIVLGLPQHSRLFVYYNARELQNPAWVNDDSGAYIRDAMKSLFKFGVPTERTWGYKPERVNVRPSETAYTKATSVQQKLLAEYEYVRVPSLYQLKLALSQGMPVVFGFEVTQTFDNIRGSYTEVLPLPVADEPILGGHAVAAVGYEDNPKTGEPYVWVRNSYGKTWGDGGHFKMDQRWFTDRRRLVDDLWTLRRKV